MPRPQPVPLAERLLRLDFLAGVGVGLIALAILAGSASLSMGEISNFGPGFLPRVLGCVLAAGALAMIVSGLTQPREQAERVRLVLRGPAMVGLGILFFAVFIRGWHLGPVPTPQLGLMVVGPVTIVLTGFGSREARLRELIVLGFGLTAGATLLFADLLGMQVPIFPGFADDRVAAWLGFDWPARVVYVAYFALAGVLFRAFGLRFAPAPQEGPE